ncbi:MAG: hypothetical protein ACRD2C_05235 [Acidimicrobiales bacterium]
MRKQHGRRVAIAALALVGVVGSVMAVAWSPTSLALVQPAAAGDDDDDDGGGGDDDSGQVPAGGIDTGAGGTADLVSDRDAGRAETGAAARIPSGALVLAAGGLAALAGRLVMTKLAGRQL